MSFRAYHLPVRLFFGLTAAIGAVAATLRLKNSPNYQRGEFSRVPAYP
ncbi:hypothetical protein HQN90_05385 [Paenibacillus alba]|nr:hypothetical protein [Paenibacillus alba]